MADGKDAAAYPPQQQNPPPYSQPPNAACPQQPPNPGYPPAAQQPMPTHQTVVVTTVSSPGATFRDTPVMMQCPNCQNQITSCCSYENGMLVWIIVLVIALVFQLWLGCCLIPLCIDSLKDVRHTCPVCKFQLGLYKRL
ncbi:Lipopolysaccharide-induced tumor necrosis factor-alpha factor-like [Holothuria leucospilota]|uniref:Lipopolysaccharide-induced tumor necrosis factor-alpha factor-like n=1 Tax=Holothuria leucospilota TaxID=206669 RepID=A0A9Q1C1I3_HOLLE|nr:Lipopolysaccharide-induced tumor necrosis factor-alpha factor-like [Holothuria leucospilota]